MDRHKKEAGTNTRAIRQVLQLKRLVNTLHK